MTEERCWFCRRGKEDLIHDMPLGFWDEQQPFFHEVEMVGNICDLDKVRPNDPRFSRHFSRADTPTDQVCAFDDRRYLVVMRKRQNVQVCQVCQSIVRGSSLIWDEGKGGVPHRTIYGAASDDRNIARTVSSQRSKDRQAIDEYPDEVYRVLSNLRLIDHSMPLKLWDLSNMMNVFNHRTLEGPVEHILRQCPQLGELNKKELCLSFNDPDGAEGMIEALLRRYEERHKQDAARVPSNRTGEAINRIKKVNDPTDTLQFYAKW
jgi:hypothetical protein